MGGSYFKAINILVITMNSFLTVLRLSITGSDLVDKYAVSVNRIPKQVTFHSNVNNQ